MVGWNPLDEFFDPHVPATKMNLVVQSWESLEYEDRSDMVRPFGRRDPVVVSDVRAYPSGMLEVVTLTLVERTWFHNLLAGGGVIGLRPYSTEYGLPSPTYLAVGKVRERRIRRLAHWPEREWQLDVQVVEAPA